MHGGPRVRGAACPGAQVPTVQLPWGGACFTQWTDLLAEVLRVLLGDRNHNCHAQGARLQG